MQSNQTEGEHLDKFYQDNEIEEETSNIDETIVGYKATDEARICRFTKPDGTCFKGSRCTLSHEKLRNGKYIYLYRTLIVTVKKLGSSFLKRKNQIYSE